MAFTLAACAGDLVQRIPALPGGASDFRTALYGEYVDRAKNEYGEADYANADWFALKAYRVTAGRLVRPDNLSSRTVPADKLNQATSLGYRLNKALDASARARLPKKAARAQMMYDCWLEESEENIQPKDIAACRAELEALLPQLEAAVRPAPKPAPAPAPAAKPAPVKKAAPAPKRMPGPFWVYFDFDKSNLNPEARLVIQDAVVAIVMNDPTGILLEAHADRAGGTEYNLKLS
jgi:OOP family OmpA-OmpF porin